jgi:hypothetical protein
LQSTESEEDSEPETDTEPFQLLFDIPCGDAASELEVTSTKTRTNFVSDVCHEIGCKISGLCIGYIFSFLPKNQKPLPKILNDEMTWATLIKNASNWLGTEQKKNGKGVVKPWSIRIYDLIKAKDVSQAVSFLI